MKAWVLADSSNGYTWAWKLYTGKDGNRAEQGLAHRVVLELLDDDRLTAKGYLVYTDNFYSSPALFRARRGLVLVGQHEKTGRGSLQPSVPLV